MTIQTEIERRIQMWQSLTSFGDTNAISASVVRSLGFFSGQAGIYRDVKMTHSLTKDGAGIAVSLFPSNKHYSNEYSETELIYHYPSTNRAGSTDINEIQSVKNAGLLGIPIFIISLIGNYRKVKIGRVASWDDITKTFLILIDQNSPVKTKLETDDPSEFKGFDKKGTHTTATTRTRPGQIKFKFNVIKRYGSICAVCNLNISELLEAAHIISKKFNGSDDPRNGLILCANHHAAFDSNLFGVNPDTLEIVVSPIYSKETLGITRDNINHLPLQPHIEALQWKWNQSKSMLSKN